tara:strand:+ start:948 stop:1259 length:312 start_codon:yes stop_codon:yes gene_type:complete
MSIFPKKKIRPGDLVIGTSKSNWDNKSAPVLERYFNEPSLVLEIHENEALVFFEQQGPTWYNLSKLERVYVTEEFASVRDRDLAAIKFDYSDQSRDEDDHGDR